MCLVFSSTTVLSPSFSLKIIFSNMTGKYHEMSVGGMPPRQTLSSLREDHILGGISDFEAYFEDISNSETYFGGILDHFGGHFMKHLGNALKN